MDNVYLLVWSQYGHADEVKSHSITVDDSTKTDPRVLVVEDSTLDISDIDSYAGWARIYAMEAKSDTGIISPRCIVSLRWDALNNPYWAI